MKITKSKRGQAWGIDLMVASMMFIGGIVVFYLYSLNAADQTEEVLNKLSYDGNLIAKIILSEGFPKNWDEQNVVTPGILTENKIDQNKLEQLYNLSQNQYERTKYLLNTNYNYYIFLSEKITINGEEKDGIGSLPQNPTNLVKINRITIYKEKPVNLNIYVWQ